MAFTVPPDTGPQDDPQAPVIGAVPGAQPGPTPPPQSKLQGILQRLAPALQAMSAMPREGKTDYPVSGLSGVLSAVGGAGNVFTAARQGMIQQAQQQRTLDLMRSPQFHAALQKVQGGDFASMTPGELYMLQFTGMPAPQFLGGQELRRGELIKGNQIAGAKETQSEVGKAFQYGGTGAGPTIGANVTAAGEGQPLPGVPPGTPRTPAEQAAAGTEARGYGYLASGQARLMEAQTNAKFKGALIGINKQKADAITAGVETKRRQLVDEALRNRIAKDAPPEVQNALSNYATYLAGGPMPSPEDMKLVSQVPNRFSLEAEFKQANIRSREMSFGEALQAQAEAKFGAGKVPPELKSAMAFSRLKGFSTLLGNGDAQAKKAMDTIEKFMPMGKDRSWTDTFKGFVSGALDFNKANQAEPEAKDRARYEDIKSRALADPASVSSKELDEAEELDKQFHFESGGSEEDLDNQ